MRVHTKQRILQHRARRDSSERDAFYRRRPHAPQVDLGVSRERMMRTLLPRKFLLVAQLCDSCATLEGWQVTIADVVDLSADAPDRLKRTTEHRGLTRLWYIGLRPHDHLIECSYDDGKRFIQVARESLSLVARDKTTTCGDLSDSSCGINLVPESSE